MAELYKCTFTCEAGHEMVVFFEGSREMAEDWAALLDGSSPMFVHDPREDENSLIAHCAHDDGSGPCREHFQGVVEPFEDTDAS